MKMYEVCLDEVVGECQYTSQLIETFSPCVTTMSTPLLNMWGLSLVHKQPRCILGTSGSQLPQQ